MTKKIYFSKMPFDQLKGFYYFLFLICLFGFFTIITLYPLFNKPGWPLNHEGINFFHRTIVYIQHFYLKDFLPIWSSTDNYGLGSPQPLFYHKLFYVVSAFTFIVIGSLKSAIIFTIILFCIIGAIGTYSTIYELRGNRTAAIAGGLYLVLANYTITNWLIRGAMAEFSGAMIVPCVLYYYIKSLNTKKLHPGLSITIGLLFLSHSVLSFYFIIIFGCSLLILFILDKSLLNLFKNKNFIVSIIIFIMIVGPILILMNIFMQNYNLSRILPSIYLPKNQLQPLSRYFWDTDWKFGKSFIGLTVQLDLPILFLITISLITVIFHNFKKVINVKIFSENLSVFSLCLCFFLVMFLQTKYALFFYDKFPGATYIQFPWRLLALATPLLIIIACFFTSKVFKGKTLNLLLSIALAFMFIKCGCFAPIEYAQIVDDTKISLDHICFSAFGEYQPKSSKIDINTKNKIEKYIEESGCSLQIKNTKHEELKKKYTLLCKRDTYIPLPLVKSKFYDIKMTTKNNSITKAQCNLTYNFPGICTIPVHRGKNIVTVSLPSLTQVLSKSLFQNEN